MFPDYPNVFKAGSLRLYGGAAAAVAANIRTFTDKEGE
jgi:hypothetical protein